MLIIEAGEICFFGKICSQSDVCQGLKRNRQTKFYCDHVDEHGNIINNKVRLKEDQTGKMRVLME